MRMRLTMRRNIQMGRKMAKRITKTRVLSRKWELTRMKMTSLWPEQHSLWKLCLPGRASLLAWTNGSVFGNQRFSPSTMPYKCP